MGFLVFREHEGPREGFATETTFERLLSGVVSHVVSERVLPIEGLEAVVALVDTVSVRPHVAQQNKTSCKLLVAGVALERFLSSVISHMVVENISSVEGLRAIRALELLLLHVGLDVPLQDLYLCELFLAELTGKWFDQSFALLLLILF